MNVGSSLKLSLATAIASFGVFGVMGVACADTALSSDLIAPPEMKAVAFDTDILVLDTQIKQKSVPISKEESKQISKQATKRSAKTNKSPQATKPKDTEVNVLGGLYVYVDAMGVPHYSLQKLDDNYQLFANAGPVMDSDIKLAVGMPDTHLGSVGLYNYGGASASVQRRLLNNPGLARYEATIRKHANMHGVDINLVKAVMAAESGFNSTALSPKNAMGLMQVIPPTAARYGVSAEQLMSPERNIYAGVRYLRDLSRMFQGRPDLIVAAYNAGEGAVYKYNRRIPPYAETQNYVRTVMQYYQVYSGNSMGRGNMDVNIRNVSAGKKGRVIMTSTPASSSRRAMQRLGNTPVAN